MNIKSALDIISSFLFYDHFIIAILICTDKRLLLLQIFHMLKNKQNTSFYLKKIYEAFAFICMFFFMIIFLKVFSFIKLTERKQLQKHFEGIKRDFYFYKHIIYDRINGLFILKHTIKKPLFIQIQAFYFFTQCLKTEKNPSFS